MGRRAVEILLDQITEKSKSRKKAIYERLPCRLVIRQSCGANLT
jgi:DNA-binding LacI/PurR family transcriptional regulator